MNYKADMERCLQYIEDNLQNDLTPKELAAMLGYSFYHFCRVFRICNNMPVAEYLRKRRLQCAIKELGKGKKMIDIALSAGYETPAGFAKAFRKEFGMSATAYQQQQKKTMMFTLEGGMAMEPKIIQKQAMQAVGYCIPKKEGNESVRELGAYWQGADFSSVKQEAYAQLAPQNLGEIGMWFHAEDGSGDLSYFFGPVVEKVEQVPEGMMQVLIPAATYAVFTTPPVNMESGQKNAFPEAIRKTWKYIFEEWFANSAYEFDQGKFDFEFYDQRCAPQGKGVMDIYVPVKKKTGTGMF